MDSVRAIIKWRIFGCYIFFPSQRMRYKINNIRLSLRNNEIQNSRKKKIFEKVSITITFKRKEKPPLATEKDAIFFIFF